MDNSKLSSFEDESDPKAASLPLMENKIYCPCWCKLFCYYDITRLKWFLSKPSSFKHFCHSLTWKLLNSINLSELSYPRSAWSGFLKGGVHRSNYSNFRDFSYWVLYFLGTLKGFCHLGASKCTDMFAFSMHALVSQSPPCPLPW